MMAPMPRDHYPAATLYAILGDFVKMNSIDRPFLILIAGPYHSNTGDDPANIAENLRQMNEVALDVFRLGHIPITGEAIALPLIEVAGSKQIGDEVFNEIFHPISRRLIHRIDAVLRIGGASRGADEMVNLAREAGKRIYSTISEIAKVET
jgi:hypothetical protein